jgi:transposase
VLTISPATKVFVCSQLIDMRYSFDALSGLVTTHFGMSPLSGHIFVFFSRRRDRMKLLFWEPDGFALYYKRLEHGTYSWIFDLAFDDDGEMHASDFALILAGINPCKSEKKKSKKMRKTAPSAPLQLV